jgi:hypothetical protein
LILGFVEGIVEGFADEGFVEGFVDEGFVEGFVEGIVDEGFVEGFVEGNGKRTDTDEHGRCKTIPVSNPTHEEHHRLAGTRSFARTHARNATATEPSPISRLESRDFTPPTSDI